MMATKHGLIYFCCFSVALQGSLSCFSDGELYTGTVADYRGNRPVIARHLSEGKRVDLKLDDTLGWLEGERILPQHSVFESGSS